MIHLSGRKIVGGLLRIRSIYPQILGLVNSTQDRFLLVRFGLKLSQKVVVSPSHSIEDNTVLVAISFREGCCCSS